MAYNFKKEQKNFYLPGKKPELIDVPKMNYIAVQGQGDPNDENGEYKQAIAMLYAVAYTIKMSKNGSYQIPGYFDFVVPPLEGLWWQEGIKGVDYNHKEKFKFISMIRMPSFVTNETFEWANQEAEKKKHLDLEKVNLIQLDEGKCVQVMHIGAYDDEPQTVEKMHQFIADNNLQLDFSDHRHHHEIYLSDSRRTKLENLKTVIRIPVK